jgi:hypothetical protein
MLNRERVPLAFQAGHAGSIPVTRSTETLVQQGFSRAHGLRVLLKRRSWVPSGSACTAPLGQGPARQAGHAGSIPVTRSTRFCLTFRASRHADNRLLEVAAPSQLNIGDGCEVAEVGMGAGVVIGMDPHKRSATIEVMDEEETILGGGRYTTDAAGYQAMLAFGKQFEQRTWAIEGYNGIGKHIADRLLADGELVVDVPQKAEHSELIAATGTFVAKPLHTGFVATNSRRRHEGIQACGLRMPNARPACFVVPLWWSCECPPEIKDETWPGRSSQRVSNPFDQSGGPRLLSAWACDATGVGEELSRQARGWPRVLLRVRGFRCRRRSGSVARLPSRPIRWALL